MVGFAAALLMMLIGFAVLHRTIPGLRGMRYLIRSIDCGLISVLLIAIRPWAPRFLSILLANYVLFVGAICLYCAAAHILSETPRRVSGCIGICVVAFLPLLWFSVVHPAPLPRLLLHSTVLCVIWAFTARLLFRQEDGALRYPARAVAWVIMSTALLHVVWCFVAIFIRRPVDVMHADLANAAFGYLYMMMGMGNVVGLLTLSLCEHRRDLQVMARTDALTGLLNRRAFEELLHRDLETHKRQGTPACVLLIDIDHFKQINDSLGHSAGDAVLRRIGAVLREATRVSDVLARYGGEEFIMLLRRTTRAESEAIAERLRLRIASMTGLPGSRQITASIGVAFSNHDETADEFVLRCDEALYCSKRGGRNLVTVHRHSWSESVLAL